MANGGTLEATNGGTLNLGGTFNNTGTILASGNDGSGHNSTVNLAGTAASTINGGIADDHRRRRDQTSSGSTLNGVTISSGSTVTNTNGGSTTLQGTIALSGPTATLAEAATVNNTDLHISGAVDPDRRRHAHDVR